jgi:hypothetical protein
MKKKLKRIENKIKRDMDKKRIANVRIANVRTRKKN